MSGGLAAKLESAAAIAASGVPVCIVQVGTPHAADALLALRRARCAARGLASSAALESAARCEAALAACGPLN